MNVKPGTYNLGPSDGTVQVRTGRQGMAAKAGHDLTLEARNWKATVTVDDDASCSGVTASVEPRSLVVKSARSYSAMLGALKVKDEVEIDLDVILPSESA